MLITELRTKWTEATTDAERTDLLQEIDLKTYVPFEVKRSVIDMLIEDEYFDVVNDSMDRYQGFVTAVVTLYTDLEFADGQAELEESDFDFLFRSGVWDKIVAEIGKDAEDFMEFFKAKIEDKRKKDSLETVLKESLKTFAAGASGLFSAAKEKLDGITKEDVVKEVLRVINSGE